MGNAKLCGQKLRLVQNDTVRTNEDFDRSVEQKKHNPLVVNDNQVRRETLANKRDVPDRTSEMTKEELELCLYHKSCPLQMEYFNEAELQYYENLLKLEGLNRTENKLKKKIKCKEDKLLGAGSFGTVTRGFCSNNRMTMAIKRIRIAGNPEQNHEVSDMQKEVVLLSELKHPNVVAYYDSERENEFLKIYLEYVDMGSIATMLKTYGPFPDEVISRYTRQILEGLEYLHNHGVMHRDIKGGNILVHSNGNVKLADFGSAKKIKSYASSFIGTVCWMAPEVI